ncbi:MAG: gliding motility lipoprotein GldD [Bacteroidetes bacterium]|nr:gliding motility lipoprotein GldD [Bacteroidota bacterium]
MYPNRTKINYNRFFIILAVVISFFSLSLFYGCDASYTPRPKGYFRIDLPEKKYSVYSEKNCGYSFDLPVYAKVESYNDSLAKPCWKYIRFPEFNGEVFLSYMPVNNNTAELIEKSRELAYKHTVKAESIDETLIETSNGLHAMIYDIGGNAASSVQFYATDSTHNFIRGALYFNVAPQPDSLAPVIQFLHKDIEKMIASMKFNSKQ